MSATEWKRLQPSREGRGYGRYHRAARARLAPIVDAGDAACARCGEPILPGEAWDLGHVDGSRTQYAGPEHRRCNRATTGRTAWWDPDPEPVRERDGLAADDPRWDVPWLTSLRRVPEDATWPRLMTVPHPAAVGSLGPAFIRHAEERSGRTLRWFQRLVATRLLEINADGRLVWETLIWSMARQLGKSWLLRELLVWRMHQGDRFGEPQDVLHTGKDLAVCKEVQRPAIAWAKRLPGYHVRMVNGEQQIELEADGSRWLLRARDAVYGYSASVGAVDEAWKVHPRTVDEGLAPTMVEREQPQLWLVSTAHRAATSLMLSRRQVALDALEKGDGDLLIEWSAPAAAELDDVEGWRLASPHWTQQRHRLISKQLEAALAGELANDPEEPDPIEAFRAQWLNQWPRRVQVPSGQLEPLLPPGLWADLTETGLPDDGQVWVAVEDDFGFGAAVAAASRHEDGRIEVDGWLCPDWDSALADVTVLGMHRRVRQLQVGASMLDRVPPGTVPPPQPAGGIETRSGLPLLRDLAAAGAIVHDETTIDLDEALAAALVRELPSSGLQLSPAGATHLIRALVWAVGAAHRPAAVPAIY